MYRQRQRPPRRESQYAGGMKCSICEANTVQPKVLLIYQNKVLSEFESAMKAQDYAQEFMKYPCILRYIYECTHCRKTDVKLDRVYNGV